ncbi:DUF3089 domain-containing protein [Gammaproteobacteria bacterium]|jgi:hypothetical protein|nr:DUF3089 domain-containing protein [Gammaproteobacteria bacterium]
MTKKHSPWKNNLEFIQSLKPEYEFSSQTNPEKPNYLNLSNWAALPDKDGFHNLSPDEVPQKNNKEFDVFFIHPTGYFGKQWNSSIDNTSAAYERTGSHLATQASAFSKTCNVYAPYYRQATYYSFFDIKSNNGSNALDLAYSDIADAFSLYLTKHNHGKPFFIAGHSQGALHGQRLINEYISQTDAYKNFVAAYLIGYILPTKYFNEMYPDLSISTSAIDHKSIISWCTGIEGFSRSRAKSLFRTSNGWILEPMEQSIVCQNPFSWNQQHDWVNDPNNISIRLKSDKLSLADYHATKNTYSKLSIEAISGLDFESRISNNFLLETRGPLIDKIKRFANGGDLHNFDIPLFWGAIRNNVKIRAEAYVK